MADIKRTIADMLANLFQDGQPARAITAQDVRDLTVSLQPSYSGLKRNATAATTIAVAGTYVKAAGTTTIDTVLQDMDDDSGTDNRLKYLGTPDRMLQAHAAISLSCASNNQTIGFKFAINGVVVDESVTRVKINQTTDIKSVPVLLQQIVSTNDYVELWITNETSTASPTVEEMHIHAMGFAI